MVISFSNALKPAADKFQIVGGQHITGTTYYIPQYLLFAFLTC